MQHLQFYHFNFKPLIKWKIFTKQYWDLENILFYSNSIKQTKKLLVIRDNNKKVLFSNFNAYWLMIDQSKAIKIHRYEKNWGIIFYDYLQTFKNSNKKRHL